MIEPRIARRPHTTGSCAGFRHVINAGRRRKQGLYLTYFRTVSDRFRRRVSLGKFSTSVMLKFDKEASGPSPMAPRCCLPVAQENWRRNRGPREIRAEG